MTEAGSNCDGNVIITLVLVATHVAAILLGWFLRGETGGFKNEL